MPHAVICAALLSPRVHAIAPAPAVGRTLSRRQSTAPRAAAAQAASLLAAMPAASAASRNRSAAATPPANPSVRRGHGGPGPGA